MDEKKTIVEPEAHQLDQSLGFLINVAARSMRIALEEGLKPFELTPTHWLIMRGLNEKADAILSDLSIMLFIDNATLTRHVDKLSQMGLIRRKRHRSDRRALLVSLTDKGKELLPELDAVANAIDRKATEGINIKRAEQGLEWLKVLHENLVRNGNS
ncbi:MarR family transcriptional regulator [bacterium]|nr:MarR family transcriptional regulator [bacterium]